jgi:hypothetical protein
MESGDLGGQLREHGAEADRVIACMEERGWTVESFSAELEQTEQLLADLQECTEQG